MPTVKYGEGSVMLCGRLISKHVVNLAMKHAIKDFMMYQEILNVIVTSLQEAKSSSWLDFQAGQLCRKYIQCFNTCRIKFVMWPFQSVSYTL